MRVACIVMQRNEDVCLDPWLIWHGHLFGYENLFVVDHGSDHPAVLECLLRAEARGTHVVRLPAAADYRLKGDFVTQVLRYADDGAHEFSHPARRRRVRDDARSRCDAMRPT